MSNISWLYFYDDNFYCLAVWKMRKMGFPNSSFTVHSFFPMVHIIHHGLIIENQPWNEIFKLEHNRFILKHILVVLASASSTKTAIATKHLLLAFKSCIHVAIWRELSAFVHESLHWRWFVDFVVLTLKFTLIFVNNSGGRGFSRELFPRLLFQVGYFFHQRHATLKRISVTAHMFT